MTISPPQLTTTSHAILGLLAIRPWTSYELTKQMGRSLHHFWPRAESKLYEEPKKLVAQGLATASTRAVGRRTSTVYAITPDGRRALRDWVARPGAGPALEFEQLMQVFFSENGTKRDLLATLTASAAWADAKNRQNIEVAREYARGGGAFPERAAQDTLVAACLTGFWDAIAAWAAWAQDVVADWPDDISRAEPPWEVIQAIADRPLPENPPDRPEHDVRASG
jgi:DNA-binding PadR family transcriptional regulator